MQTFLFLTRILVGLLLIKLFVNALEIFSKTRNWYIFILPLILLGIVIYAFKLIKKITDTNNEEE